MNQARIGELVLDSTRSSRGRIRYIGPVAHENESLRNENEKKTNKPPMIRVGIEWEDLNRGIHNGLGLFKCKDKQGSFVKETKLIYPGDFIERLREKYEETCPEQRIMYQYGSSKRSVVVVEEVGMDKVQEKQQINLIQSASLFAAGVGYSKNPERIKIECPNLISLDLSFNLFQDWDSVVTILCALSPNLRLVNLSNNRLDLNSLLCMNREISIQAFSNIETLVLDSMISLNEEDVNHHNCIAPLNALKSSTKMFDKTRSLYLRGYNGGLDRPITHNCLSFEMLESLDLSSNGISSWDEIKQSLHGVPNLLSLILDNNPITCITSSKSRDEMNMSKLLLLSLNKTNIEDYESITALHEQCSSLVKVNLTQTPIMLRESDLSNFRFSVIARMKGLRILNGTEILALERNDAERTYLKKIEQHQLLNEPRYKELLEKHGSQYVPSSQLTTTRTTNHLTTTLANDMLHLWIVLVDMEKNTKQRLKKLLPKKMTIKQLKLLCSRLLHIPMDQIKQLCYTSRENENEIIIDSVEIENKQLCEVDCSNDGTIIVRSEGL